MKTSYEYCGSGKRPKIAAFDFETDGLGGPVVAATWCREFDMEAGYDASDDPVQALFYFMCENCDHVWYAHNAQYDLRYLLERLTEDMERLEIYLRTDTDVFMMTLELPEYGKGCRLVIKDSLALFPATLREFTRVMCPELPKLSIDWEIEKFQPSNPEHIAYAKRDAQSLCLAIARFDAVVFQTFGVHVKSTLASTALAAWEHSLDKATKFKPPKGYDDFIRSAYYGGIVFLTTTRQTHNAKTFDLNSSYPYQMITHDLPYGNPARTNLFVSDRLGIYDVTVRSPDNLILPCLAYRDGQGLLWPSGTFRTTVTSVDLEFALSKGYRLLAVHEGIVWPDRCKPFADFVAKCRQLRFAHKGTAIENTAKRIQNSLYGKTGSKKIRRKVYAHLSEDEKLGCDTWGDFYVRNEIDDEMLAIPQWAAFVTSYARRHLLTAAYDVGIENVIYGDTDSLTIVNADIPTGNEYGQFKLEKSWDVFRARAPKVYAGRLKAGTFDAAEDDGLRGACKGIPRREWRVTGALQSILEGKSDLIYYTSVPSLMSVMKGHAPEAFAAKRSISDLAKSRSWRAEAGGNVRPRSIEGGQRLSTSDMQRSTLDTDQEFPEIKVA